ncbi:MAG: V-type ATPase subunit [Christensenellaceae bacterium]|jgi:V/A-type H+-transporting ATPase subunit C|nr:V-type ATPase subunit [Christensenellaceae bacterium]
MEDFLFANSVAKTKENSLMTSERLSRLISCADLDSASKILIENGYGGISGAGLTDAFSLLKAEEEQLSKFCDGVKLRGTVFDCFLLLTDWHNIKVLLKAEALNTSADEYLLTGGLTDIKELKETVKTSAVFREVFDKYKKGNSPRLIDTLCDKLCFAEIEKRLSGAQTDKSVKKYFAALSDTKNIASFVRSADIQAEKDFFGEHFVPGGLLAEDFFTAIYPDCVLLSQRLNMTEYTKLANLILSDQAAFSTETDNYINDIFKASRSDMFSLAPAIGYYVGKKAELSTVKTVLICKKAGVADYEITKRLRKLYTE